MKFVNLKRSRHFVARWRTFLLFVCLLPFLLRIDAKAQQQQSDIRPDMHVAYQSFRELQPLLYSQEDFNAPANEARISELLAALQRTFHSVDKAGPRFANEAGFLSTLRVTNDLIDDARNRFSEGKKGYALWRLKTVASHCISCHTRYEVPMSFADSQGELKHLNDFEKGEFYLATRQFDRARESLQAAVSNPNLENMRIDALRDLLVLHTRVKPDPRAALLDFRRILARVKMPRYEEEEVRGWLVSLERWSNEKSAKIPPLARAENLVRQGLGMNDPLSGRKGSVELLRASAIIHEALEKNVIEGSGNRAHALYLLGLAYSEIPIFFVDDLPELFFEQAIREAPGSETAQKALRKYKEIVTLNYTGSGGTRLPDDVLLQFRELHDLAYGVKKLKEQI